MSDDSHLLPEVLLQRCFVPVLVSDILLGININDNRDCVTLMSLITRINCPNDLFTPSECRRRWRYYDSELVSCQNELLQFVHDIDNDISVKYLNPVARLQIRLRQDQ